MEHAIDDTLNHTYNISMAKIQLTNTTDVMLLDDEDYPVLSRFKWHKSDGGYAITQVDGRSIRAHLLIMGTRPRKLVCDHRNRNRLDNRKCNLRWVTQKDNANNRKTAGICYDKSRNKWMVRYKRKFYGRYTLRRDAEKAYRNAKSGVEYIANPKPVNRLLPRNITRQNGKFGYGITIDGTKYRKNGFATAREAMDALNKLKAVRNGG